MGAGRARFRWPMPDNTHVHFCTKSILVTTSFDYIATVVRSLGIRRHGRVHRHARRIGVRVAVGETRALGDAGPLHSDHFGFG